MSNFRQLTKSDISDIVVEFQAGVTQAELARRYQVHHTTILYHVKKHDQSYYGDQDFYYFAKRHKHEPPPLCLHPSARCFVCGMLWDEIERPELEIIAKLTKELAEARSTLRIYGHDVE